MFNIWITQKMDEYLKSIQEAVTGSGKVEITDRYLGWVAYPMNPDRGYPRTDVSQDQKLVGSESNGIICDDNEEDAVCKLIVFITRKVNTGDVKQDRVIDITSENRFITARGV